MKPIQKISLIALLICFSIKAFSQYPNISYPPGGPFTFSSGLAVNMPVTNSGTAAVINGQTTTIAGSGSAGYTDATGSAAAFNQPLGAVVDASGNIYVTDVGNQRIRKISPLGVVTTFAGTGTPGSADGTGTGASFYHPVGMCIDGSGNIYVADEDNNMIRKITPGGVVTTVAGQTGPGYVDGAPSVAKFNLPCGIAIDAAGNLYVADNNNNRIRKITPSGTVSTFAGSGTAAYADGQGIAASFNQPFSVTIDASGNLYVADRYNHRIRKITSGGYVSTLAGNGTLGFSDGTPSQAMFNYPTTVTVDNLGNVYVADYHNNRIRKVTSAGVVTTLAGTGVAGSYNSIGNIATFNYPFAVALDASSNVIVCDLNANLIRKVVSTPYTISATLPAGLSFNSAAGTISGTPTTVTAASNYLVTAYGSTNGSNSTVTLNISVNAAGSVNPSPSLNFITTYTPRTANITSTSLNAAALDKTQMEVAVQYFDGLGRPLQTVQAKGSPLGYDMVQPKAYDVYGRESTNYLPYAPQTGENGSYRPNAVSTDQSAFYSSPPSNAGVTAISNPYSQINFEASPLNRVVEQGAPGAAWQPVANSTTGHTVKTVYTFNNSTAWATDSVNCMQVALYTATINANQSRTLVANGNYYSANQLDVTITKDENWISGRAGTTEEYKDKQGRVVLKRVYNYTTTLQRLSTYYVYDDLGDLAFVLPPIITAADSSLSISQTKLDNFCYQYRYDERNRQIQKKIPGKGWEFTVYNTLDQPVMAQDANQRNKTPQQWTFSKYDAMGRLILTGMYTSSGSTADTNKSNPDTSKWVTLRNLYKNTTNPKWENRLSTTTTGYDELADPVGHSYTYYTSNYYGSYAGIPGLPSTFTLTSGVSTMTAGLPTVKKTAVLNTPTDQLWDVIYYDDFGRITKTYAQHYLGGIASPYNYDLTANTYNFTNEVTTTNRQHYTKNSGNTAAVLGVTVWNRYLYDHMGRKIKTWEQLQNGTLTADTKTLISKVDYNEIGQVSNKHLHSTVDSVNSTGFMQNIAYTYNERGWLLTSSAPLFAMSLFYNTATYKAYNGNIMTQYWGTPGNLNNHYSYGYDRLNRMTSGSSTIASEQNITYDLVGNITALNRYSGATLIDQLTYTYKNGTGNQLQSINDGTSSDLGLKHGLTSGLVYDGNGNLTTDPTKPSGTVNIGYNLLNLPQNITGVKTVTYIYDAAGTKLRKVSTTANNNTDYIDGIQYDGTTTSTLSFIQTEEGKAVPNGTTAYNYFYYLGDNLGNTRITFDSATGSARMIQKDDYYPFGMEIIGNPIPPVKNEYLYNKKELQEELTEYDYGARFYDPVIARWNVIDPLAEKDRRTTPYAYGFNNPIVIIDPDGMFGDYYMENGAYLGSDGKDDDKLYSVKNDAKIKTTTDGKEVTNVFNKSDATDLTQKFGVTASQFKDLAGTVYAEMATKSKNWKEGAGIYSVLENRGDLKDKSAWQIAQAGGIYGWDHRTEISDKDADPSKAQAARHGVLAGIMNDFDYSGGAYFWQGVDFHKHYKLMHAYEDFYKVGFRFTDTKDDIWHLGNHLSGRKDYKYMYQSTGTAGKTTFMKYTDEYRKANHHPKQWP